MTRPFRLATVLRIRRIEEERAAAGLARANARAGAATRAATHEVARHRARVRAAAPGTDLRWHLLVGARSAEAVRRAVEERAAADLEVATERAGYALARQRVAGLERLEERDARRAARAAQRRAQRAADDLAAVRHLRRGRDGT
ncbi:MAG: hypothetical protein AB7L84_15020 [Acidimicrobiia bacterium]